MGYCDSCLSAGSVNTYGYCEICGAEHAAGSLSLATLVDSRATVESGTVDLAQAS